MNDTATPKAAEERATAALNPATGPLTRESLAPGISDRDFLLRVAELAVFLTAIVGAVALGLGITDYFTDHAYIGAYLLAYAGFRCADLLVRGDYGPNPARDALARRITDQLPLLALFVAAPFERTYLYGGEAVSWLGALGLLLELAGLWFALGARIQLGFFSREMKEGIERRVLVQTGFYRFIRHPIYAGVFVALFAWSVIYGAPISMLLTVVIGTLVIRTAIAVEEAELLVRFGEEYAKYRDRTDAIIPSLW
jgi:protein-S-isoprenylcysteine O-methyltransferase Ste14